MTDTLFGSDTGRRLDEMPGGVGEFGLEASNPIPVQGIAMIKVYLGFLATPDYQRIKFKRVKWGSIEDAKMPGLTDEYDTFDQSGKLLTVLYVNAYAKGTSERAPQGFIYFRPFKGMI